MVEKATFLYVYKQELREKYHIADEIFDVAAYISNRVASTIIDIK